MTHESNTLKPKKKINGWVWYWLCMITIFGSCTASFWVEKITDPSTKIGSSVHLSEISTLKVQRSMEAEGYQYSPKGDYCVGLMRAKLTIVAKVDDDFILKYSTSIGSNRPEDDSIWHHCAPGTLVTMSKYSYLSTGRDYATLLEQEAHQRELEDAAKQIE